MWREFKPALRFVGWFVGLYVVGNLLYGLYVTSCGNTPDAITQAVSRQSAWLLSQLGFEAGAKANPVGPTVWLQRGRTTVLDVYEGCNGVNVFIVFVAFVVAFGGPRKKLVWFLPLGMLLLHLANLARLVFLYWIALNHAAYFYYVHKYIFTLAIYAVVFVLWMRWIKETNGRKKEVSNG